MKTYFNLNSTISVESQINSIFNSLSSTLSETSVVVKDRAPKGGSCKGFISVFNKADLRRQNEEEKEYREYIRQGYSKESLQKTFKATPSVKYAFYPNTISPDKLGSVAIYGKNLASLLLMIKKNNTLFGHRVISATTEIGIRPFLDVKVAA